MREVLRHASAQLHVVFHLPLSSRWPPRQNHLGSTGQFSERHLLDWL